VLPSLELNWLRKDKDIPMPLILFEKISVGGYYCRPAKTEWYLNGKHYPLDNGLLVVNIETEYDFIVNGIAHEWRHHWQWWMGVTSDCPGWNGGGSYKKNIMQYFLCSRTEMDALLFSNKMYPSNDTLEWYDWLVKYQQNKEGE